MKNKNIIGILLAGAILLPACGEQGGSNPPPPLTTTASGGSSSASGTGGQTSGQTGGQTSGVDSSGDSGGGCVDCPEEEPGTCPGHAEWNRGLVLYGLWENDNVSSVRSVNPSTGTDDPECSQSFSICLEYDDASDVPEEHAADLLSSQMEQCNALTNGQAQAQGLGPVAGWTLVHHWCRTEQGGTVNFGGQSYTLPDHPSADVCNDAPWAYQGYCSEQSCPEGGDTDTDSGTGSSTGESAAFDCSAFGDADLDWGEGDTIYSSREITYIERTAGVSEAATLAFSASPYEALSECAEATIDRTNSKIYAMERTSFLGYLGIVKNDVVFSVNGKKGLSEIIDSMAMDIDQGNDTTMKIKRQRTVYIYTVSWNK